MSPSEKGSLGRKFRIRSSSAGRILLLSVCPAPPLAISPASPLTFLMAPVITAVQVACALGNDLDSCVARIERRESGLRPLGEFFGKPSEFSTLLGGWIPDRKLLLGRRYGVCSNAAVQVSRAAVRQAGWSASEVAEAWLFVGSSRGNAPEMFGMSRQRRPIQLFRASNLMHSELAAAVSIELGLRGPWQVLSNGCASGLDALGLACLALQAEAAERVLVVAADMPLVPELLAAFQASGVLSRNNANDPYGAEATGFLPGEAAVAVTLESAGSREGWCSVHGYSVTSDAYDPIGQPKDGQGMAECMRRSLEAARGGSLAGVIPHASGTLAHAAAELKALEAVLPRGRPSYCMLVKPYVGHALGASGLLDVALAAAFIRQGRLLPNVPGLSRGSTVLEMAEPPAWESGAQVLKLSVGMGGHNAAVTLRGPVLPPAGSPEPPPGRARPGPPCRRSVPE